MSSERTLYGLVLAGGNSRRMGQDKAAMRRGGQSQLEFAFDLLARLTSRQFVSVRAGQAGDPLRARFPRIVDRDENIGPLAGILAALGEYPASDWLVVACDLPNLELQTLRYLVENAPPGEALVAYRSSVDGMPEPLCALYRAESAPILRRAVNNGSGCPRKIMQQNGVHLLQLPNPAALHNVNTPEDLEAIHQGAVQ
ncbi:MAG TPA: NTP transferase domain-containing protein [Woeseiaceae bacterium]|nr:NTP transferase domain-containing protein [Woeseiaceae bacterium]